MPENDLRIYVHLGYEFDAEQFRERFRRGESWEYTPFDFHLVERPGIAVSFSSDKGRGPRGRLTRFVNRRLRFLVDHAWNNRRAIAASDVVWTMSENEMFAVAALMMLRIVPRRPIIGTAIWLFEEWPEFPRANRALFRLLSRYITVITVHSKGCLPVAARARLNTTVEFSPFGINERTYSPRPLRPMSNDEPIHVLAAGNDPLRDWSTLLAALGNDDRFIVSIWTRALGQEDLARFRNLRLPKPVTGEDMLAMYDGADVVVVPLIPNVFSGITVALEAAALGKPVIASSTGGIPSYFSDHEVKYVAPQDANALRDAVLEARGNGFAAIAARARARFVEDDYTTRAMIDRYLALTRRFGHHSPPS